MWFFLTYRLTNLVMSSLFTSVLIIQLNYYIKILLINHNLLLYHCLVILLSFMLLVYSLYIICLFYILADQSWSLVILSSFMLLVYSLYIICLFHILADWSWSLAISICCYSFCLLFYATTHHSLLLLNDLQNISTDWSQSLVIQSIHSLDVWHHSFCYYWSAVLYYYLLCYIVFHHHLSVFRNTENMMREIKRR